MVPFAALGRRPRRRVGLLGGSFNPAHDGHRHIAREALRRLQLDEVWLLVSPHNPLKPEAGMAGFAERLAGAGNLAVGPLVSARGIEATLGLRFTADTVAELQRRFPRTRFIWLMGADNLVQLPRWQRWTRIFHTLPVAVFARPGYDKSLMSKAPRRFARARIREDAAVRLWRCCPPAWVFIHSRLNPTSATAIRAAAAQRPDRAKVEAT